MKKVLYVLLSLWLTSSIATAGEKRELKWTTFNNALEIAKKNNKRILIDVYTDWCGWCKKMDQDVYGNQQVANYLDSQFVLAKLNAESPASITYNGKKFTEMTLASYFGITGYPTSVFLEPNGQLLSPVAGYIEASTFLTVCEFFGEGFYLKMNWKQFQEMKGSKNKK